MLFKIEIYSKMEVRERIRRACPLVNVIYVSLVPAGNVFFYVC